MTWDLRRGDYRNVLADVQVDAVITDPPYSERVHRGHDDAVSMSEGAKQYTPSPARRGRRAPGTTKQRRELSYPPWTEEDVEAFVAFWAPRNRGWFVVLSDSELCAPWRAAFEAHGLKGFHPLPCLMPGMSVRLCGDGPSSWSIYANVARPRRLSKWGALPGGYYGPPAHVKPSDRGHIGGKPLWLMRALIRDYSRPGDLVCDPCAGAGTTLIAAQMEGRRAIGAECDPETFAKAKRRLNGLSPTPDPHQTELFG